MTDKREKLRQAERRNYASWIDHLTACTNCQRHHKTDKRRRPSPTCSDGVRLHGDWHDSAKAHLSSLNNYPGRNE